MRVVRRRVTVFGGILLAIIIILSIMLVVQNKAMIKQQLSVNIRGTVSEKARREIALKEELSNLNNKDYIEKVARDDYYLSNKGEVIFKLPNNDDDSKSKSSNDN